MIRAWIARVLDRLANWTVNELRWKPMSEYNEGFTAGQNYGYSHGVRDGSPTNAGIGAAEARGAAGRQAEILALLAKRVSAIEAHRAYWPSHRPTHNVSRAVRDALAAVIAHIEGTVDGDEQHG